MADFVNIGFGNLVNTDKVIAIVNPDAAPVKRMVQNAKEQQRVIDATQGRRTKAVVVMETEQIVLSAVQPDTIARRLGASVSAKRTGMSDGDRNRDLFAEASEKQEPKGD
ncbi:MAG: DUF370 domain-containing protein [Lachnospiraceae bacterium]|nr:DUF370 domain-containing protein [Lachnospiraceae bacterium]